MDKILARFIDTASVLNVTNATTLGGGGIIGAGIAIAQVPEPHAATIGGIVIILGLIVSAIKGKSDVK